MPLCKPASGGSYLKAGFLGFEKSGKTHTAMDLAIGIRRFLNLAGSVYLFDTEKGNHYWRDRVLAATGRDLMVCESRTVGDLLGTVRECCDVGAAVLVVDSITHVWRDVCDSYLIELQEAARKRGRRVPDRLEFQDWSRIKAKWGEWPDLYLNAPLHIIVCGRAGHSYDYETNDRGQRELIKTGVKMKAEAEFGFEPSLLVEMERDWNTETPPRMVARATVIGDRFNTMNGATCEQPTFDFFRPFVELLAPSRHTQIESQNKTTFGLDEERADTWKREKDQREVLAEKIKSALVLAGLDGKSADDRKRQVETIREYWGTTSWKEIAERTPSAAMRDGLRRFEREHGLVDGDDVPDDFRATEPAEIPDNG